MAQYCLYFSPTGGTKRVCDLLTQALGGEWIESDLSRQFTLPTFTEADLCILALPSFGGRIPTVIPDRLHEIVGNGAKAIALCVYGNRAYDDTLSEMQDLLTTHGFTVFCGIAALAEHSILRQFAANRPDTQDADLLRAFAGRIRARLSEAEPPLSCVLPGAHDSYKPYQNTPFLPERSSACIGCMRCAKECPTSAIDASDPFAVDASRCIKCMRCAVICPKGARVLNAQIKEALTARLAPLCADRKENELFL